MNIYIYIYIYFVFSKTIHRIIIYLIYIYIHINIYKYIYIYIYCTIDPNRYESNRMSSRIAFRKYLGQEISALSVQSRSQNQTRNPIFYLTVNGQSSIIDTVCELAKNMGWSHCTSRTKQPILQRPHSRTLRLAFGADVRLRLTV